MNILRFFLGFSFGFLIGGTWGLMNAPEKGYKTRKRLSKKAQKQWKQIQL